MTVKSQTNLVCSVSPDIGAKLPVSRLLLVSWPGEASRPFPFSGAPELFLTVSTVCGQCNATQRERVFPVSSEAEWSVAAAKLASQSSGAGETVRILGAIESRWVHGRRGASGERSASVRSVKPGCCAFPTRSEATIINKLCRDSGLSVP